MISFQDLMKGFGVVTVMNACIYKLAGTKTYKNYTGCSHQNSRGLIPEDFECTHLYLDTLKISNLVSSEAEKTVRGGQNKEVLLQYGRTMTLEMHNALGSAEVLEKFFGCEIGSRTGAIYVTNKFPDAFAIEGDTFFIEQKTGRKVPVKIFIPNFRPNGVLNLTQDAEGDAAVFDCSGVITATNIIDTDHPLGHEVFYLISNKSWVTGELNETPATIEYVRINNSFSAVQYISYLSDYTAHCNKYNNTYIVRQIGNDGTVAEIPATYNGLPVRGIADKAAYNCTSLKKVIIPSSVQAIGAEAFAGCFNLATVQLQEGQLFHLGPAAFSDTESLTNITLPQCLQYIHANCFNLSNILNLCEKQQDAYVYDGWVLKTEPQLSYGNYILDIPSGLKISEDMAWGDENYIGQPMILNYQDSFYNVSHKLPSCVTTIEGDLRDITLGNEFLHTIDMSGENYNLGENYEIILSENTKLCGSYWLNIRDMFHDVDDCNFEPCRISIKIPDKCSDYFDNFMPFVWYPEHYVEISITYV